jgi:hypothetical protein
MAKMVARNVSLAVWDSGDTQRALSGYSNSVTLDAEAEALNISGWGDSEARYLHGGIQNWQLNIDGYYAEGLNEIDQVMHSILGGSTYVLLTPAGSQNTTRVEYAASATCTEYHRKFMTKDAGVISAVLVGRSGSMTRNSYGTLLIFHNGNFIGLHNANVVGVHG